MSRARLITHRSVSLNESPKNEKGPQSTVYPVKRRPITVRFSPASFAHSLKIVDCPHTVLNTHTDRNLNEHTSYIEFHTPHILDRTQSRSQRRIGQRAQRDLGDTSQAKLNKGTDGEQGLKRRAARAARDRARRAARAATAPCAQHGHAGLGEPQTQNNVQLPPRHLAAPARGPAAARAGGDRGARVCCRASPLYRAVPAESRSMSGITCAVDGHAARTSASATPSSCTVCTLLLCAGRFSASCAASSLLVGASSGE